jgi:rare lipoprotein A
LNSQRILIIILGLCLIVALAACSRRQVAMPTGPKGGVKTSGQAGKSATKEYTVFGKTYKPMTSASGYQEEGRASWYGSKFHGRLTSNKEVYNMEKMTAAHKTLPFNTWVKVENLDNGRSTTVRVNDRGPFVDDRVIDLSRAAARDIGMIGPGTAMVRLTALGYKKPGTGTSTTPAAYQPAASYTKGNFTVQVGAFTNESNAYRLAAKMRPTYGQVAVVKYDRGDKVFHRVRVGKVATLPEAYALQNRLRGSGHPKAIAVAW